MSDRGEILARLAVIESKLRVLEILDTKSIEMEGWIEEILNRLSGVEHQLVFLARKMDEKKSRKKKPPTVVE